MFNNKLVLYLLPGILFIGSGVILIALDYKNLRENYKNFYINFSRNLTPEDIKEKEPHPYTEDKLKSDLKKAEEYLRQNSKESIRLALDIYNTVYSFSNDLRVKQLAKYGLAYSLYKLNDENRALLHLRELKTQKIQDTVLEEEVDYLLGRILLLRDYEDEGRSILQNLLVRTTSNDLKSRIHLSFGDYYQKRRQFKKARQSYLIALEYNPDNLHAEIIKENLKFKNKELLMEYDSYNYDLSKEILKDTQEKEKQKKEDKKEDKEEKAYIKDKIKSVGKTKKETKQQEDKKQLESEKENIEEEIERIKREIAIGLVFYNNNDYLNAKNTYIQIEKKINQFLQSNTLKEKEKNMFYELLENTYFRLGEVAEKENKELAKTYYDKVLNNPNIALDQVALIKKGIIYFESENYRMAYELFKKALEISPNGKYSSNALEWLKETEKILKKIN